MAVAAPSPTMSSPLLATGPASAVGGPVLEDTFLTAGNRSPVRVSLHQNAITITPSEGGIARRLLFRDIVGAEVDTERLLLTVHSYHLSEGGCCGCIAACKPHRYHVRTDLFHQSRDIHLLRRWQLRITQIVRRAPLDDNVPTRHLLILINPASGSGKAAAVLESVRPLFRHANVKVTEKRTEYAQHAFEIAYHLDVFQYDAIVTVSGDGLLAEVVNGLFNRRDWRAAVSRLQLGTIPGGSGNGVAKSVLHSSGEPYSALSAAFLMAQGYTRALDIFTLAQDNKRPTFGFLSFSWAVISDIDLESEEWRCCGGFRFTWTALNRLCCLRRYNAVISYIPADNRLTKTDGKDTRKSATLPKCGPDCRHCTSWGSSLCETAALERYLASEGVAKTRASVDPRVSTRASSFATSAPAGALSASETLRITGHHSSGTTISVAPSSAAVAAMGIGLSSERDAKLATAVTETGIHLHVDDASAAAAAASGGAAGSSGVSEEKKAEVKEEGALHPAEKRDTSWVEMEDTFVMIWALNVTHAANDMHAAPYAHLSDGSLDFAFVRGAQVGCCSVFNTFLQVETGEHVNNEVVEYIKVRALRLQPRSERKCELNVDGERVGSSAMEIRVFRGILNFICR